MEERSPYGSYPRKCTTRLMAVPGTPSVLFFKATLPLKPTTFGLKIGHLAFQVVCVSTRVLVHLKPRFKRYR